MLRMHVRPDGSLTIYPLGVDRIGRDWSYEGNSTSSSRFQPRSTRPAVRPIDAPLHYDATGRRVT